MSYKDEFLASWRVLREDWVLDTEGDIKKANQILFGSADPAPDADQEQANDRPMLEVDNMDEDVEAME